MRQIDLTYGQVVQEKTKDLEFQKKLYNELEEKLSSQEKVSQMKSA